MMDADRNTHYSFFIALLNLIPFFIFLSLPHDEKMLYYGSKVILPQAPTIGLYILALLFILIAVLDRYFFRIAFLVSAIVVFALFGLQTAFENVAVIVGMNDVLCAVLISLEAYRMGKSVSYS
ncbi:hypothetical protein [Thermoplasma sp.]|uniref:hypothetical protein n=1 Tax=Thermoplasma sp. TaxID=1973142 RepID=UPI001288E4FB|nr:hypothetical protein [Thermoplasma sp.]KAA8921844.1 MAG: hypothetical protein F6Q11_07470 [Thermoplasma sp.]